MINLGSAIVSGSDPTILSVSTAVDTLIAAEGSTQGGTTLYVKGTNFNIDPTKNQIFIGAYPCLLKNEGLSSTTITCVTTRATDPTQMYGLKTTLNI
jgi:hypothetical protein